MGGRGRRTPSRKRAQASKRAHKVHKRPQQNAQQNSKKNGKKIDQKGSLFNIPDPLVSPRRFNFLGPGGPVPPVFQPCSFSPRPARGTVTFRHRILRLVASRCRASLATSSRSMSSRHVTSRPHVPEEEVRTTPPPVLSPLPAPLSAAPLLQFNPPPSARHDMGL